MSEETFDALVVGAGVGGLSAAITLAHAGRRVLVLEAHDTAGGKAGTCMLAGVEVDTGPSVLTLPDVFEQLIRSAGLDPERELSLRRLTPSFRYLFADGVSLDLHHELKATLESVHASLGAVAAEELARFLRYARDIWQAAAPAFVFGPAPSVPNLLRGGFGALRALLRIDPLSSMRGAIERHVRSPHLRLLLSRYATYNGSDPRCAPATLNCIAHVELALGGYGVEGGMAALVRALERAARRLGVVFRFSTPVDQLCLRDDHVTGVRAAGRTFCAPNVVVNADVAHMLHDLLPAEVRPAPAAPGAASMSGYNAIYRVRRQSRAAHTVLFPPDYSAEFADIFDHDRPPLDPSVYVCAQEVCHGRAGWPEHEALFVMANAPAEPAAGARPEELYTTLAATVRASLVRAGVVDADAELLWERTPRELARRFPGSRGSIYGAASNDRSAAFRRPGNAVAGVRGLFLASGSAHPGGGLPLAAQSGRQAAAQLMAQRTDGRP
ncbi:MAG TPA: phytoene desaturase family protein [Polyangiales bacterium]